MMRSKNDICVGFFKCVYESRKIFRQKPIISVKYLKILTCGFVTACVYSRTVTAVFFIDKAYRVGIFFYIFFGYLFTAVCRAIVYNNYIKLVRTFA